MVDIDTEGFSQLVSKECNKFLFFQQRKMKLFNIVNNLFTKCLFFSLIYRDILHLVFFLTTI